MPKRRKTDGNYFWDEEAGQWYPKGSEKSNESGVSPALIGGRSMEAGKLPEGFKDKLREMKKKQGGHGADHLI